MNETPEPRTDGRMTWNEAVTGPLAAATCLWQDLDGVHIGPAAAEPPPTSILWAWNDHVMIRVRLDGTDAYVATCAAPHTAIPTLPWGPGDGPIQQIRVATGIPTGQLLNLRWAQFVQDSLNADGETATGPVTFMRPTSGLERNVGNTQQNATSSAADRAGAV